MVEASVTDFRALGLERNTIDRYKDIRMEFNGSIRKEQVKKFKQKYPKAYKKLFKIYHDNNKEQILIDARGFGRLPAQELYKYLYPEVTNICLGCGAETRWKTSIGKFREFCSLVCSGNHSQTREKAKESCKQKWGTEFPFQSKFIQATAKLTWLRNLGVDHPHKSAKVREKLKKTNLERYGEEETFHVDSVKEKIRETNIANLGVANPFESKAIQAKIKETNLKNLGVEHPAQSPVIQEKMRATSKERYGFEHIWLDPKVRERIGKVNLERYGAVNPFASSEIQQKIAETNIEKFGAANPFASDVVKKKILETNRRVLGVDNPSQSKAIQAKKEATCYKRYGLPNGGLLHQFKRKTAVDRLGKVHSNLQGYEPLAIEWLNKKKDIKKIETLPSKVPHLVYVHPVTKRKRNYIPDMMVTKVDGSKRLIEVKSSWTLGGGRLEECAAKAKVATRYMQENGGDYIFMYFNNSKKLYRVYNPETIEDLAWLLNT